MSHSYWVDMTTLVYEEDMRDFTKYDAFEGNSSDKVASLVISNNNLLLQCDKYTFSITNGVVNANCDGEIFNTFSSAILANDHLNRYLGLGKNNIRVLELIMTKMDKKIAAIILNILMYDMYLFINASK